MSKALKHKIMLGLSIISNSYKNLWDIDNCHFTEQEKMAQKKVSIQLKVETCVRLLRVRIDTRLKGTLLIQPNSLACSYYTQHP